MDTTKASGISRATVLGGGAFGTAMAQVLAVNGVRVKMWVFEAEVKDDINNNHMNSIFLPGVHLSKNITATSDFTTSLKDSQLILIVIPTQFLRGVVLKQHTALPVGVPLLCCSKGIETSSLLTPYEILVEELPGKYHDYLAALSGPSFAKEVAVGMPTSVTVAAVHENVAKKVQVCMSNRNFNVFTATDVIGAEICGAVKNVVAIACGMSNGLNLGHNTLAMLITRGLGEITRLAIAKGGYPSTMSGFAGLGDLVLTCTSVQSRNFTVGMRVGKGEKMKDIVESMKSVAEGVETTRSVKILKENLGVDMPLCEAMYQILWEDGDVKKVLRAMGDRPYESDFDPYAHFNSVKHQVGGHPKL